MCGSMVDIQSVTGENRQGKKEEEIKKEETTAAEYNGLLYWAATTTDSILQTDQASVAVL